MISPAAWSFIGFLGVAIAALPSYVTEVLVMLVQAAQ